jgi:hypothetical protein
MLVVVNRSLNMFSLIALGTGAAYLYSLFATFAPGMFPAGFREMGGTVAVYFEAAAVITVLVLLGQVLELRAREQTGGAIRALLKLAPKTARPALRRFNFDALRGPALAGLPRAREGFFIASTHWERGIVAGPESTGHGLQCFGVGVLSPFSFGLRAQPGAAMTGCPFARSVLTLAVVRWLTAPGLRPAPAGRGSQPKGQSRHPIRVANRK